MNYPELCYVYVEVGMEIGIVKFGEKGYYRTQYEVGLPNNELLVDKLNSKIGVSKEQAEAMKILSMNDSIDGNYTEWKSKFNDIVKRLERKQNA